MKIILLIIILVSSAVLINAQTGFATPSHYSCERMSSNLGFLINSLKSNSETLFVISRLGAKENSSELTRRRLHNVRTYFKENSDLDSNRLVFASGDKADGEGRVEFYIGSSLQIIALVERNKDFCVDCCEFGSTYYGWGKTDKPRRKNR